MKKTLLKSALMAVVGVGLMAGSASAITLEWGIIEPTALESGSDAADHTFGYYIWTDDVNRTSWHIRWEDTEQNSFSGVIALENNTGVFSTFNFEATPDFIEIVNQGVTFFSKITPTNTDTIDGIDFVITPISSPSYVGFDLTYFSADMDPNYIFLGANGETVASLGEDQDFKIAAPVPEPATMLLFGTGLAGLAGVARRRKK